MRQASPASPASKYQSAKKLVGERPQTAQTLHSQRKQPANITVGHDDSGLLSVLEVRRERKQKKLDISSYTNH